MAGITREELEEYVRIRAERLDLDRQSKAIEVREKKIIERARDELIASKKRQITRFGFGLVLEDGKASVSWKDAFIDKCGAAAAAELQTAAAEEAKQIDNCKAKIVPPIAP